MLNEYSSLFYKGEEVQTDPRNPLRSSVVFIDAGARLGELYKMEEEDVGSFFKITENSVKIREDLGKHVDYAYLPIRFEMNRGNFTNAEFHLFEPNPEYFDKLCETAKWLSKVAGSVYVHRVACSTEITKKIFKISDGGWGSTLREHKQLENFIDETEVQTIDLIDFLHKINERKITKEIHVKLDIEGSEYDVLPKMFESWAMINKISTLSVEFHSDYLPDADAKFWNDKIMIFSLIQLGKIGVKFNWWPGEW